MENLTEFPNVPSNPAKNWEEDYPHENGKYQNKCCECQGLFFGHKRRVICKECANKPPDWEKMAQKKAPTQHEGWAWQGCWADGEMTGFARCMVKKVKPLQEEIEALKKLTASGSVAAPKEESLQWPSKIELPNHSEKLESENTALREALKEFAQILLDYKHSGVEVNIDYLLDKFPYENIEGKI